MRERRRAAPTNDFSKTDARVYQMHTGIPWFSTYTTIDARRVNDAACALPFPIPTFRTLSHDFDTVWCGTASSLTHDDAHAAHIIAVIEGPQRDCVLTWTAEQNVERVALARTVGNAIVGKYLVPGAALDAHVSAFDAPSAVFDIKYCTRMIAGDLGRIYKSNSRRRIVEVHRFANSLARQSR